MRKVSTTVYLDDDQYRALVILSRKTSIPQAVIVRKGVDLALAWFEEREALLEKGLKAEGLSS
jgi:predicted transcriptional regulator